MAHRSVPALPLAARLSPQRWATRSQQVARRNAMAACTVLATHRHERVETEEFVAAYLAQRAHPHGHHVHHTG